MRKQSNAPINKEKKGGMFFLLKRLAEIWLQLHKVLWCFVHVCFLQVTILKLVWRSFRADAPRCTHLPTDICFVIQKGEIIVEKCAHRGASARRERRTLSLGRIKHGHNNSAPFINHNLYNPVRQLLFLLVIFLIKQRRPYKIRSKKMTCSWRSLIAGWRIRGIITIKAPVL